MVVRLGIQGDASQPFHSVVETVSRAIPTCQHPKRPGGLLTALAHLSTCQPMELWQIITHWLIDEMNGIGCSEPVIDLETQASLSLETRSDLAGIIIV